MPLSVDPVVEVEEIRPGYARYRNTRTGRRWEVRGTCDRRGDCVIGAVFNHPDGSTIQVESVNHLKQLVRPNSKWRDVIASSGIDTPVTPEFNTCCGSDIFTYVELSPA